MNVLTDNYKLSQVATLNENGWPFCENDRPFWREYALADIRKTILSG
jgi:hypothetical protein